MLATVRIWSGEGKGMDCMVDLSHHCEFASIRDHIYMYININCTRGRVRRLLVACEINMDIMASKLSMYSNYSKNLEWRRQWRINCTVVFTTVSVRQCEIVFSWYWERGLLGACELRPLINLWLNLSWNTPSICVEGIYYGRSLKLCHARRSIYWMGIVT